LETYLISLFFAFSSAISWSILDTYRKICSKYLPVHIIGLGFSLLQIPVWLCLTLYNLNSITINYRYITPASIGIVSNFLGNIFFLVAITRSPISRIIPLLSTSPVISAILSFFILDEILSVTQIFGAISVLVGAVILWKSPDNRRSTDSNISGEMLMILAATSWSITTIADKQAIVHCSKTLHGLIQLISLTGIFFIFALRKNITINKIPKLVFDKNIIICALVGIVAYGLQLTAIAGIPISVFETIKRGTGMVLSTIIGRVIFKEVVNANMIISVLVMGLGVYLVLNT
jgi:drug/metabolite transporter (DMT)-like permease